jgi:hypothetical protein
MGKKYKKKAKYVKETLHKDESGELCLKSTGDTDSKDWEDVLDGVSYDAYVAPIIEAYKKLRGEKENVNRDDILRDVFNNMAGGEWAGTPRNKKGVLEFYESDTFGRLLAFELCQYTPNKVVKTLSVSGNDRLSAPLEPFPVMLKEINADTNGKFKMLDHGSGDVSFIAAASLLYPNASYCMYDFSVPSRRMIEKTYNRFLSETYDWSFLWASSKDTEKANRNKYKKAGPYDFIISNEVIEHCTDPLAEVEALVSSLKVGGKLMLGTFFNSCEGQNPQHLAENDIYQDWEKWFELIEAMGLKKYHHDPRGICKVWIKE